MEADFWHQKWQKGEIAFHQSVANPLLTEHFEKLNLPKGSRVFLPLCGKTRDFDWLLSRGYRVAGAELSELAINELFSDLGIEAEINRVGELIHYRAKDIDLFVGDIFNLTAETLGPVDAVYDRAALVALPADVRNRYTAYLLSITATAPQLLVSYEYDQQLVAGPPFSISKDEVEDHYGAAYRLNSVACENVIGGMKGKAAATETVWLLQRK